MFGMLDYRAHKLYLIIFGIPYFLIRWMVIIGLPIAAYDTGLHLTEMRFFQIIITVISLLIYELIVQFPVGLIDKFFMFIFNLFVDVIPSEDRTKEEAIMVVRGGNQTREILRLSKINPREWTDEDLLIYQQGFFVWFFRQDIATRLEKVREYFTKNNEFISNSYMIDKCLKEIKMEIPLLEQAVCNPLYRFMVIEYLIAIYLILFNPFS